MPSAAPAVPVVPRDRGGYAGRVLGAALLLGGFLVLAFVLCGRAQADPSHADPSYASPPRGLPALSVPPAVPAPGAGVTRNVAGATGGVTAAARTAGGAAVTATAAGTRAVRPVSALLGAVGGTTHRAGVPVVRQVVAHVSGLIVAPPSVRHGGTRPRPGTRHRSTAARAGGPAPHAARPTADRSLTARSAAGPRVRTAAGPAPHLLPGRHVHGSAAPFAPDDVRSAARNGGHPAESDGGAHHAGGACPSAPACGARPRHDTAARAATTRTVRSRRASDVSVQPD